MSLKIKRRNIITWMFFFVVIAMENFSWLIPAEQYLVPGLIKFSDIGVLSALVWMLFVFLECKKTDYRCRTLIFPLLFILLIFVSGIAADFYFNQSLALSFRQNRYIIISFLMYYAIIQAMRNGKLNKSDLIKIIKFQAFFEIVVFILQYLLVEKVVFVYTGIGSRYNEARLRVSYLLPLIFAYFALNEFMNGRNKVKNIVYSVLGIAVLAIVCKHRAPTMIVFASLLVAYIIWKKGASTKTVVAIVISIAAVSFVSNSQMFQDTLSTFFAGSNGPTDNFTIRLSGHAYYFQQLTNYKAWFVGFSKPNINNAIAYKASGALNRYFLEDNGIFGFVYCHGLLGLIWLVSFYTTIFNQGRALLKKAGQYQYILYILYEIGNLYMGMHWYYYYAFPFVLFLSIMTWDYNEMNEEK